LNKLILYYFYTYSFDFVLYFSCLNGCVGWQLCSRLWAWNRLPLNTYSSMYARTNRCYNKRGSRTNYVCSSIPHCMVKQYQHFDPLWWVLRMGAGNFVSLDMVSCLTWLTFHRFYNQRFHLSGFSSETFQLFKT